MLREVCTCRVWQPAKSLDHAPDCPVWDEVEEVYGTSMRPKRTVEVPLESPQPPGVISKR